MTRHLSTRPIEPLPTTALPPEQGDGPGTGTAAIVVTYNRKELLVKCLDSLLRQTEPLERIYVVDNASTDGTEDVIPDDERVTYLRLEGNLGGAYGFAYGVREALRGHYRYVWVMDDDCFAEDDALERLLRWDGAAEALCGAVLARDGSFDVHQRRNFNPVTLVETPISPETYAQSCVPIDMFTFVGTLIRVDAVRRVGLPVDDFFFMADDSEYALRLGAHGLRILLIPASRMWHHGSVVNATRREKYNPKKHYYHIRNGLLIRRRYGRSRRWFAVRFCTFALLAYGALAKNGNLNWRSATLTAHALRDALLGRAFVKDFGKLA